MDLITAKYETKRIFNEETDYCYVENYEGNLLRIKKKEMIFFIE